MSVAKVTEIIADSAESFEDAVRKGSAEQIKPSIKLKQPGLKSSRLLLKMGR